MGTLYTSAVGTPPVITSLAWLTWYKSLLAYRLAECSLTRGTTYYFAQSGNDSTGDGSSGNPWKTLSKAQAIHDAAGSTANLRLRFKRGDTWKEPAGLQITKTKSRLMIGLREPSRYSPRFRLPFRADGRR